MPINELTAEPTLRLMLATAGENVLEGVTFDGAWRAFREFALIPSVYGHDVLGFHVILRRDALVEPATILQLGRELRWPPKESHDTGLRRVVLTFEYETLGPGADEELFLWSDEFPGPEAFLAAVEASRQFRAASTVTTWGELSEEFEPDDFGS